MTEKTMAEKQKRVENKRKRNGCQPITFSEIELKTELMHTARAINMPVGAAEEIATRVVERVGKWAGKRPAVTVTDIHRRVALEIEKYSPDLAYVYQNRGKII